MGRREFYAWVEQAEREITAQSADDPHSWKGTDEDEWWQQARQRREAQRAR